MDFLEFQVHSLTLTCPFALLGHDFFLWTFSMKLLTSGDNVECPAIWGIYASSLKAFSFSNCTVSCVLMLSSGISSSIALLLPWLSGTLGLPWVSFLCAVSTRLYLSQSSSGNHGDDLFYFTLRMVLISLSTNLSVKATISWVLCICLLKAGVLGKHQLIRYCRKGDLRV